MVENVAQSEPVCMDMTCPGGLPAFIARPVAGGPHPAVILMHERYGLVAHTKDLARRCARDGYFVMAPDFFYRHPDQAALHAGKARYAFGDEEAVTLLKSARAALAQDPQADTNRLAVAGYCQTGRHPLVFAAEVPVMAAVVWYGAAAKREWEVTARQPKPLDDILAALPCPVFGAFGSADHIIAVEDVCRLRDALERHGKSYDLHIYADAPHGWLNDTMPGRYRARQAAAAWAAQQAFLNRVLRGAPEKARHWRFEAEIPADYDFAKNVRLE